MNESSRSSHFLISGTGRCGTSFLVAFLTRLGLDTGFEVETIDDKINKVSKAGLEFDLRKPGCPYIVKSPWFCRHAEDVLRIQNINIEHVLIPIRDLYAAAESRRRVSRISSAPGGLWRTDSFGQGAQEAILAENLYQLILALTRYDVPFSFLEFPRFVADAEYLYSGLKPLLADVSMAHFNETFASVSKPEWVNDY